MVHRRYHRRHGAADAGVRFGILRIRTQRGFWRLGRHLPLPRVFISDSGCALWRSDGTAAGTMMVKDLDTETYTSSHWSYSDIYHPTIFGNLGFFAGKEASIAPDGTVKTSWDLWQTDGTTNGTVALSAFGSCHSIYPGCHRPEDLIGVGSNLYFGQLYWLSRR